MVYKKTDDIHNDPTCSLKQTVKKNHIGNPTNKQKSKILSIYF